MPIDPSVLQRRHWQDGRIRLGIKKMSQNGKEYPAKIKTLRFTSPSEEMIRGVAEKYGGQARPWQSPEGPQFEVITDATRIPVIVPPNGFSQNMELWDGKLCVRRCTGITMQPPFVGPCQCGASTLVEHRPCKPHSRLGVFLKEVRSLGLWRLDSKGKNAAAELPNAAEFLAHAGTYVDAWLYVAERTSSFLDPKDGKVKAATYMVPGLTIEGVGFDELMSGEVARRTELGRAGGDRKAIEAAPSTNYLAMIEAAKDYDEVVAIWKTAKLDPAWQGRGSEIEAAAKAKVATFSEQRNGAAPQTQTAPAAPPPAPPAPPAPAATAQPEGDPEADRLRQHIMTAWSGTTTELHVTFREANGTTMKAATLQQLKAFADRLGKPAPGPIADEPRKASERAEALYQAAQQYNTTSADDEIVDADIVEDQEEQPQAAPEPVTPASGKLLRELSAWFTEAGITIHTGKGSTKANDDARFAWIAQHIGVTVTSTKELNPTHVGDAIKLLMQQAAARRADLQQRIVNVWADLGGTNDQLTTRFEQVMNVEVAQATNANLAEFLRKLSDSEITPDGQ